MKPFDETKMIAYTISRAANHSTYDRNQPHIINKVVYRELPN